MSFEPYVDVIVICATGWGVRENQQSDMHDKFYVWADKRFGCHRVKVLFREFDSKWNHLAARLDKLATPGCKVIFAGHSFGCGVGYRSFEKAWRKLGRAPLSLAVLIDPVSARFGWLVRCVLAFTTYPQFKVKHADEVLAFRQVNKRPLGERVKWHRRVKIVQHTFGSTKNLQRHNVLPGGCRHVNPDMDHNNIDKHRLVIRRARDRIAQVVEGS